MSTPASSITVPQITKLNETLGKPPAEVFQYLIANGDLVKMLQDAGPRLSQVDRSAFGALLTPAPASINWTPVSEYVEKIAARSKLRGWGLTKGVIESLASSLVGKDHAGPLNPLGVQLWLGHDLAYNYDEMNCWLKDEVEARGENFKAYPDASQVSFLPGSELSGKRRAVAVGLDLQTFWDPTNGVIPRKVRSQRSRWPGLEVGWLLALSPQVYLAIDYKTIPGFIAPGLVVDSDCVLCFSHVSDDSFVSGNWDDYAWHVSSLVGF